MLFSDDMRDLVVLFEKHKVDYALVGGHAVNFYGYVRSTQDIDLLIYPSKQNASKVMTALAEFGFGEAGIPIERFETPGSAIHLGVEPNRIDLLTHLKGMDVDQVFANLNRAEVGGILLNVIGRTQLIEAKRGSDRLKDQADAEELDKLE